MLPLVWTDEAQHDLLDILDYIAARNPVAAERLHARYQQSQVLPPAQYRP
jgi:plasmid stabilization system protein ParE